MIEILDVRGNTVLIQVGTSLKWGEFLLSRGEVKKIIEFLDEPPGRRYYSYVFGPENSDPILVQLRDDGSKLEITVVAGEVIRVSFDYYLSMEIAGDMIEEMEASDG